jgi:hypothetical protein
MAANGNYAQRWITAVDEIRSGGEIVDNLAGMSEAPVLLAGGLRACAGRNRRQRWASAGAAQLSQVSDIAGMACAHSGHFVRQKAAFGADGLALTAGEERRVRSI